MSTWKKRLPAGALLVMVGLGASKVYELKYGTEVPFPEGGVVPAGTVISFEVRTATEDLHGPVTLPISVPGSPQQPFAERLAGRCDVSVPTKWVDGRLLSTPGALINCGGKTSVAMTSTLVGPDGQSGLEMLDPLGTYMLVLTESLPLAGLMKP